MRVAYVSQHALHHLEDHLDKTPNQYIRLRYGKGEDKEEAEKVSAREVWPRRAAPRRGGRGCRYQPKLNQTSRGSRSAVWRCGGGRCTPDTQPAAPRHPCLTAVLLTRHIHHWPPNVPRIALKQVTRVLSPEEEEAIKKQIWVIDGQNRVLEKLLGRRKKKKSFEYEIKWVGLSSIEFNR